MPKKKEEKPLTGIERRVRNPTTHGFYFKGIMVCDVCGLKDCPHFELGSYCKVEIDKLSELDEMNLPQLRAEVLKTLAMDLIRLSLRIRIRSSHTEKVSTNIVMKTMELLTKYVTASKGKLEVSDISFWKKMSEDLKEEEKKLES